VKKAWQEFVIRGEKSIARGMKKPFFKSSGKGGFHGRGWVWRNGLVKKGKPPPTLGIKYSSWPGGA